MATTKQHKSLDKYEILKFPTFNSFIIGLFILYIEVTISDFMFIANFFIYISIFSGIAIFVEIMMPIRNKKRIKQRLTAAIILILTPLLLLIPDSFILIMILYMISGILIAIHGVWSKVESEPHSGFYIYLSSFFIILIPLLEYKLFTLYYTYMKDIYVNRSRNFSGCHIPIIALDILPIVAPPGILSIFSYSIQKFLYRKRMEKLTRKMEQEKIIPFEFKEISESDDKKEPK